MSSSTSSAELREQLSVPAFAFDHLDEHSLGRVLRMASDNDCSDIYIKSGFPLAVKKHDKKFYIGGRAVRKDEMTVLINQVAGSGAYERVSNGQKYDLSYRLTKDRGMSKMVYRVNIGSYNGNRGVTMTIRAVRSEPPTSSQLELPTEIVNINLAGRNGLGVFIGETGSGKSTSAAGLIVDIMTRTDQHVLTLESPIEIAFEGIAGARTDCTQYEVGKDVPNFVDGIKSALRENPNFIYVGECRGSETMDAALTAAETGHSVLTTLHVARGYLVFHRIVSAFEQKQQSHVKTRLADLLNYVCYQVLTVGTNGKRLALREYLVLDQESRNRLLDCQFNDLSKVMFNLFKERGVLITDDINAKYAQGRIDKGTYNQLMTRFEAKEGGQDV